MYRDFRVVLLKYSNKMLDVFYSGKTAFLWVHSVLVMDVFGINSNCYAYLSLITLSDQIYIGRHKNEGL